MGLPVVSFASGGIPEAVAHRQTGFLSPERDEQGLATSLLALLRNPNLRTQFSEAGRSRVEKMFSLRAQARRLENTYEELLNEHESSPRAGLARAENRSAWSNTNA